MASVCVYVCMYINFTKIVNSQNTAKRRASFTYEVPMRIIQLTIVNQTEKQKLIFTKIAASSILIFTLICLFSVNFQWVTIIFAGLQ